MVKILVPTFYALGDTRIPVRSSIIALSIKVAINFPLTWLLGYAGLALSTSIAALVNFALLSGALRRKIGGIGGRGVGRTCSKIALASVGVGGAALGAERLAAALLGTGRIADGSALAAAIASGLITLALASKLLRIPEMDELAARFIPHIRAGLGGRR